MPQAPAVAGSRSQFNFRPPMQLPVYLDHQAATPIDPRVIEAMLPISEKVFGNPSSLQHRFGRQAHAVVEAARLSVARIIGADPDEIIFTSGATESNNLAIRGLAERFGDKGRHIITCSTEHKSVLEVCRHLEEQGFEITTLPVDTKGLLDLNLLKRSIRKDTILISVMAANNEIGVLHPLREIGMLARENGVFFHTDAAQGVGKIPINVDEMKLDLLSFSSHKMYGPKGVGVLYVRKRQPRVRLRPLILGGGHEAGLRSGTLPVVNLCGLGKACEIAMTEMHAEADRVLSLRKRLQKGLLAELDMARINGALEPRLPHNLNMSFAYVESESLFKMMDDVAISTGAACASTGNEPSHVLKALGSGDEVVFSSVRFSLGRFTTEAEIDYTVKRTLECVKKIRAMSPLYRMAKEGRLAGTLEWSA
jgi:cysteine desulfurase